MGFSVGLGGSYLWGTPHIGLEFSLRYRRLMHYKGNYLQNTGKTNHMLTFGISLYGMAPFE